MRLVLVIALIVFSCRPAESPGPGGQGCEPACQNMSRLGCELGRDTPGGHTCVDVCERTEAGGISFSTSCLALAGSCEAADSCE